MSLLIGSSNRRRGGAGDPGVPANPIFHWTMNSQDLDWGIGTAEIRDVSGNGNHANAFSLSVTDEETSPTGGGLNFNNSAIAWARLTNVIHHGAHSIGTWLYVPVINAEEYYFFCAARDGGNLFQLYFRLVGTDKILRYWNGSTIESVTVTMAHGTWHFIGCTHDGASTLKLYANNAQVATRTLSLGSASTGMLTLGRDGPTGANYMKNITSDTIGYNRELTAAEMLELYNRGT